MENHFDASLKSETKSERRKFLQLNLMLHSSLKMYLKFELKLLFKQKILEENEKKISHLINYAQHSNIAE